MPREDRWTPHPMPTAASRAGLVLGLLAVLVLLAAAVWLATVPLSSGCTSSTTMPAGGGPPVDLEERCYEGPSYWDKSGPVALLWLSVPGLTCLAALALTPFARLRAVARWLVAVPLFVVGWLAVFTPFMLPLVSGGVLMIVSAALSHDGRQAGVRAQHSAGRAGARPAPW